MYNGKYIICVWYEAAIFSYQDATYKASINFCDKHTPIINASEIYVVDADSFVT